MKKLNDWQAKQFLSPYKTDESKRVLEIGAGARTIWRSYFPNLTTFDIAAEKKPDVVGDAHQLPFEDASFDLILCSEVFEHLYNPFLAAAEIKRVLVPGGLLLLTTRFSFPVHDAPADYFRFTPYGLRELFKDFDIIDEGTEGETLSTVAILLQRIIFQTTLRGGKLTKGLLYVLALILNSLDFLVIDRYGDITRKEKVPVLLAAGVFIVCRKRS